MTKNTYTFCVRHYFGLCYVLRLDALEDSYEPMLTWLKENCKSYTCQPMDNSAYSDVNEDPWTGYHIHFDDDDEAAAFKLKWWYENEDVITYFKG